MTTQMIRRIRAAALAVVALIATLIPTQLMAQADEVAPAPGPQLVLESDLTGRLIWSRWETVENCPPDGYVYDYGEHSTDPAKGNGKFVYQSAAMDSGWSGLNIVFQYWEGYDRFQLYYGCDSAGQGFRMHIPTNMTYRVDEAYLYKTGGGQTAFVDEGSWQDGNMCAQYEPATFNDRSRKDCHTWADFVFDGNE